MKICFATNNKNKLKEITLALGDGFTILSLAEIGCTEELPENQDTLEGNSLEKASYVFQKYGVPCFADDTGLEVGALNGRPGVYSARYAGVPSSSEKNIDKLLSEMSDKVERKAQFRTVITLITEEGKTQFEGRVLGEITQERSGKEGFGYDPVFQPEGYSITFSEMSMSEKNAISHRGKAVQELIDYLKK